LEYKGPPASWISSHDELTDDQDYETPEIQSNAFVPQKLEADVTVEEAKTQSGNDDMARQTGDISTWIYYGKSIGTLLIILVFALIVTAVFAQNFQSMIYQFIHPLLHSVLTRG
jgi:hypothetical protein